MTNAEGAPGFGGGAQKGSSKTYLEGTPGCEQRDRILAALRGNRHDPYTNSDNGYRWFIKCPSHKDASVRISEGPHVALQCLTLKRDVEPCTPEQLIESLGLSHLIETPTSYADKLRDALVDSRGLDQIEDPEPLIGVTGKEILFRDSLVWAVGKPGHMKSFVTLDMAGSVATGELWQGYPTHQGDVLYLVAEGVRGIKKRVRAWERQWGIPMTGVHFLPIAVQAGSHPEWNGLIEVVRELKPVMIILDTQARITVGVEENSNTAMGEFVNQAERLRAASGACVVIVHHIGRVGETGRGATVLDGAMSTVIKISKDDDQVTLECQKNKDGEEWEDIVLRAIPMGESIVMSVDSMRRSNVVSGQDEKLVSTWRETFETNLVSIPMLVEASGIARATVYRSVNKLVKLGMVEQLGTERRPQFRLKQ